MAFQEQVSRMHVCLWHTSKLSLWPIHRNWRTSVAYLCLMQCN